MKKDDSAWNKCAHFTHLQLSSNNKFNFLVLKRFPSKHDSLYNYFSEKYYSTSATTKIICSNVAFVVANVSYGD